MAERFVVLPLAAVMGNKFASFEDAGELAGKKVDADGVPHVIVQVVGEARRRMVPNVEVVRFDAVEAGQ